MTFRLCILFALTAACADHNVCNGIVEAGEECDDGNQDAADGCDCAAHPAWLPPLGGIESDGFVVVEDDGAWCWFQDERAVMLGDRIAVSSVSHAGDIQVSSVDLVSGAREHGMLHRSLERDDHDAASLIPLPDGRVAAFYTRHDGFSEMRWRVSESSALDAWSDEHRFGIDHTVTYSNPFLLAGEQNRLYLFFRGLASNPTVATSENLTATWSTPKQVLDSYTSGAVGTVEQRPYVKYVADTDAIHMFYTEGHPTEFGATGIYHLVYRGGELLRSDGTEVARMEPTDELGPKVPPARGTQIYDGTTAGAAWPWDAALDSLGRPIVVYSIADAQHRQTYHYARWDGTRWLTSRVGFGGTSIYDAEQFYAGGITIDPNDPSVVYLAANVDPQSGDAATPHFELYRARTPDSGETWAIAPVTHDSTLDNLRPVVPIGHRAPTTVVWMQGTYQSYIDYNTRIVALVGDGAAVVAPRPAPEPIAPLAHFDLRSVVVDSTSARLTAGNVSLELSNVVADGDHVVASRGCTRHTALDVRLTGLTPDAVYLVRLRSVDTRAHYLKPLRWFFGDYGDDRPLWVDEDSRFLGAHRPGNSSDGGDAYIDLFQDTLGGAITLAVSGLCDGESLAFVDAVDVFELPVAGLVAFFAVEHSRTASSGIGKEPLVFADGAMQATASQGGIAVTVTSDQREPYPTLGPYADAILNTSVHAHDSLAVDVTGLSVGARYLITVYSRDVERYLFAASRWQLEEAGRDPRVVKGMLMNARTYGNSSYFMFVHVATMPSFRLRATDVLYSKSTDPSMIMFNGIRIERLP